MAAVMSADRGLCARGGQCHRGGPFFRSRQQQLHAVADRCSAVNRTSTISIRPKVTVADDRRLPGPAEARYKRTAHRAGCIDSHCGRWPTTGIRCRRMHAQHHAAVGRQGKAAYDEPAAFDPRWVYGQPCWTRTSATDRSPAGDCGLSRRRSAVS